MRVLRVTFQIVPPTDVLSIKAFKGECLILSRKHLWRKTGAELAKLLGAIPPNVTTLDLSSNEFGDITGAELAEAFRAIPANVTTLNLSSCNLRDKTAAELAEAFRAIPANVTTLNLSYCNLRDKTAAELVLLGASLANITSLILGKYFLNDNMMRLFKHGIKEGFLRKISDSRFVDYNNLVVPTILNANSEAGFANLVTDLEQFRTPIAYLSCALLLSDEIKCFWDGKDDDELAGEEYSIKRLTDALNFYMLAAKDPTLLSTVITILSLMKHDFDIPEEEATTLSASFIAFLKNCCNKLEARPVIAATYKYFKDNSKFEILARLNMQVYANEEEPATDAIDGSVKTRPLLALKLG